MVKIFAAGALVLAALAAVAESDAKAMTVWPKPQSQSFDGATYVLEPSAFAFDATGPGAKSDIISDAFKRYRGIMFGHGPTAVAASNRAAAPILTRATVNVASADESLTLETDESYVLKVTASGIDLSTNTVYGAVRGLETLSQVRLRTKMSLTLALMYSLNSLSH